MLMNQLREPQSSEEVEIEDDFDYLVTTETLPGETSPSSRRSSSSIQASATASTVGDWLQDIINDAKDLIDDIIDSIDDLVDSDT
ncbi:AVN_HP_G0068030.mRNA.1.CDS.1 [Saccharomyces cerevisiae]|nr:AVN_HP_G0058590.mRNA.1.CDS.1 [Saccharomyces cerevisiae]CAI5027568.1 AVN_HP_G0068030.mRNA.1.CDS.1 [Saccharomyces cerevisiae]CAI6933841.1 AVN_HP_G0058590.mRNA.1.CDS.1 [Saccharomyces cerevisiae]CAI6944171.1 AVN_HP_G0068030.mRNA.1.CDS.1 [Saccharomyces cerevisiae]